eukprot:768012-Hanusia_phi.AAC.3
MGDIGAGTEHGGIRVETLLHSDSITATHSSWEAGEGSGAFGLQHHNDKGQDEAAATDLEDFRRSVIQIDRLLVEALCLCSLSLGIVSVKGEEETLPAPRTHLQRPHDEQIGIRCESRRVVLVPALVTSRGQRRGANLG